MMKRTLLLLGLVWGSIYALNHAVLPTIATSQSSRTETQAVVDRKINSWGPYLPGTRTPVPRHPETPSIQRPSQPTETAAIADNFRLKDRKSEHTNQAITEVEAENVPAQTRTGKAETKEAAIDPSRAAGTKPSKTEQLRRKGASTPAAKQRQARVGQPERPARNSFSPPERWDWSPPPEWAAPPPRRASRASAYRGPGMFMFAPPGF